MLKHSVFVYNYQNIKYDKRHRNVIVMYKTASLASSFKLSNRIR